jgi:succinate-semialdehyde dehydrogenase/glutarate-semialdehyde dehydrogenase
MSDYAVVNPATGETLQTYPTITDAELADAIGRADAAHRAWAASSTVEERAGLLRTLAGLYNDQAQRLGEIIVREMGKPIEQAVGEVEFSAAIYEYYADNAASLMADEEIEPAEGGGTAVVRRSSYGLLLGIMPWNYPYYQVARFAAPNLAIGNTMLLKHAPQCPESAAAMEELFHEAGFPRDAYINIYATNDQIADVIADPRVRGVSLTGSERAGAAVAEIAGRNLKKVVLELGGSDPFLLLSTDDLDSAVESAVGARLENSGQACNAAKRFIVVDELYDAFLEKFTAALTASAPADPTAEGTTVGPLSSALAAERLEEQVQRAVAQGAKLSGGGREGNFFAAGVLTGITPDNDAYHEELFGPVAVVHRVADDAEAIALANDSPYGLGGSVFSEDLERARRVADRIESGMVFINHPALSRPELPFGGIKRSGYGRELADLGMMEFANRKLVCTLAPAAPIGDFAG